MTAGYIPLCVRDDDSTRGLRHHALGHDVAGLQRLRGQEPVRRARHGASGRVGHRQPVRGWCRSTAPTTRGGGVRPTSPATSSRSSSWPRAWGSTSPTSPTSTSTRSPERLARHRCLFSLGHDEYWSSAMRTGATRGRGARLEPGVPGCQRGVPPHPARTFASRRRPARGLLQVRPRQRGPAVGDRPARGDRQLARRSGSPTRAGTRGLAVRGCRTPRPTWSWPMPARGSSRAPELADGQHLTQVSSRASTTTTSRG